MSTAHYDIMLPSNGGILLDTIVTSMWLLLLDLCLISLMCLEISDDNHLLLHCYVHLLCHKCFQDSLWRGCNIRLVTCIIMHNVYVCGGLGVSMLVCQLRGWGSNSPRPGQKFGFRFLLCLHPLANSAIMSTLIVHCQWGDEIVRERTGHPS